MSPATHTSTINIATRRCRRSTPRCASSSQPQQPSTSISASNAGASPSPYDNPLEPNPLETLRVTRDPVARARLLQQLDGCWSEWTVRYKPTPVEEYLSTELGIWLETVMLAAVQDPGLTALSLEEQVKPAVRALKAAGLDNQALWFTVTKCVHLLAVPIPLSRWLDFLSVYGLRPRDLQNFLLRAPRHLFDATTLYQAGTVVSLLKGLGITDEFLAARVLCVWPAVLARDVESELRPVLSYLMALGLSVQEVGRVVCTWPEVLLGSVDTQLRPFAQYLKGLGCSTEQVAEVLVRCPHLVGFKPEDVFGKVLRSLEGVGIGPDGVRAMLGHTAAFLISSGVQDAIDQLRSQGYSKDQVRRLALADPRALVVPAAELGRAMRFLREAAGGGVEDVMACPLLLTRGLAATVGPRVSFVVERPTLRRKFEAPEAAAPEEQQRLVRLDWERVLRQEDDVAWCSAAGISVNEFIGHKKAWDDRWSERLHQDSASEFQEELKKLGIYEGQ